MNKRKKLTLMEIEKLKVVATPLSFAQNKNLVSELSKNFPLSSINSDSIRFNNQQLAQFLKGADAAIIGTEKLDESLLQKLPQLKVVAKYGVGLDNINEDLLSRLGIDLLKFPGTNKRSVAELTLALMLSFSRQLNSYFQQMPKLIWNKQMGMNLSEKTIGLIGVGNIGKEVIKLLAPFNMRILANDLCDDKSEQKEFYHTYNVESVSKSEIYRESQLISLHLPLTDETQFLIGKNELSQMRPDALLINTARGSLVNFQDLKWALEKEIIAGAAFDVFDMEPFEDESLLKNPRFLATPHIGGTTDSSVWAMGRAAIKGLKDYFFQDDKE